MYIRIITPLKITSKKVITSGRNESYLFLKKPIVYIKNYYYNTKFNSSYKQIAKKIKWIIKFKLYIKNN